MVCLDGECMNEQNREGKIRIIEIDMLKMGFFIA